MSGYVAPDKPWTSARTQRVKRREHSHARIHGFYVSADLDEYGVRWYIGGRFAGYKASASGELPEGSTLVDARRAAEEAIPKLIAAGMVP